MLDLQTLGWKPQPQLDLASEGLEPARVIEERRGSYRLATDRGEVEARVSGRLQHQAAGRQDFPAVGDWVAVTARIEEGAATIHRVLPRRSQLVRKVAERRTEAQVIAANLDSVWIVTSCNRDFNPRRIERTLALVWESGAQPLLVLTKTDLIPSAEAETIAAEASGVAFGVPVHAVSAATGDGLDDLRAGLVSGHTFALVGSSGVGKSTLANALLGEDLLDTGSIRHDDDRGRHTTVHRQLVVLPGGALLIDTPGMRELQLWDASDGVETTFEDVEEIAGECRFVDCQHDGTPGCAVEEAIQSGQLDAARLGSYHKLQRELAFLDRKQDQRAMLEERRKWKQISKSMKRSYRDR